jgi:hypothetical protein
MKANRRMPPHWSRIRPPLFFHPRGAFPVITPHRHPPTPSPKTTCKHQARRDCPHKASREKEKNVLRRLDVRRNANQAKPVDTIEGAQNSAGEFCAPSTFVRDKPQLVTNRPPTRGLVEGAQNPWGDFWVPSSVPREGGEFRPTRAGLASVGPNHGPPPGRNETLTCRGRCRNPLPSRCLHTNAHQFTTSFRPTKKIKK